MNQSLARASYKKLSLSLLLGEAYQLRANCFLGFIKFEAIFILGNFFDDEDAQTEGNKEQDFFHVTPFVNVYFLFMVSR